LHVAEAVYQEKVAECKGLDAARKPMPMHNGKAGLFVVNGKSIYGIILE
jgi:hypothetical protein